MKKFRFQVSSDAHVVIEVDGYEGNYAIRSGKILTFELTDARILLSKSSANFSQKFDVTFNSDVNCLTVEFVAQPVRLAFQPYKDDDEVESLNIEGLYN